MRTTIDIPDPLFREMKIRAATEGTSVREIVLEGLASRLGRGKEPAKQDSRLRFPVIRSKKPGSLKLGEEGVYEYIPFP
jgi:plasmid stability protein